MVTDTVRTPIELGAMAIKAMMDNRWFKPGQVKLSGSINGGVATLQFYNDAVDCVIAKIDILYNGTFTFIVTERHLTDLDEVVEYVAYLSQIQSVLGFIRRAQVEKW